jgi:hypothetical protein
LTVLHAETSNEADNNIATAILRTTILPDDRYNSHEPASLNGR